MIKVAERFYSIQGEGYWAGTPMCFVRTSQCPVGGPEGICTNWDGTKFKCDTGPQYKPKAGSAEWHSYTEIREVLDPAKIWEWASEKHCSHVVLTGGEPAIQRIRDVLRDSPIGGTVHIETSGTVPLGDLSSRSGKMWITLSPKENWLPENMAIFDELKLLVNRDTTKASILPWIAIANGRHIFLQPIDEQDPDINSINTERAIDLCKATQCRLSLQLHKLIGVR